ncbi:mobile mystery protein A [bacterium]|jgi:predicted DNA-binding mobile mystery protein A|nr:mobile mystery protein A [bacterium]
MNKKKLQRTQLDKLFSVFKGNSTGIHENVSWINLIRTSLGMTLLQLAQKLSISAPSLKKLETNELKGTITLNSLKRVADQLDCDVVYALLPRTSLTGYLKANAYKKAARLMENTIETMDLENQALTEDEIQYNIEDIAEELIRKTDKQIWNETN